MGAVRGTWWLVAHPSAGDRGAPPDVQVAQAGQPPRLQGAPVPDPIATAGQAEAFEVRQVAAGDVLHTRHNKGRVKGGAR